jgi:uncharacterized protein (TIGR02453 family)
MKFQSFKGFSPAVRNFFVELSGNNDRQWFAQHKLRYEDQVLQPAMQFVAAMEKPLRKISPFFTAIPKRQGGSIIRIYRDIRFSKNKVPFKTHLGIHFRHEMGSDIHAPGIYFHIAPDSVFMGGGIWQPENQVLNQIRVHLEEETQAWKKIKANRNLNRHFYIDGSSLRRPPKGYPPDHPLIEDLKRKDHFVTSELSWEQIGTAEFIGEFTQKLKIMFPYMRFLCDALRIPS